MRPHDNVQPDLLLAVPHLPSESLIFPVIPVIVYALRLAKSDISKEVTVQTTVRAIRELKHIPILVKLSFSERVCPSHCQLQKVWLLNCRDCSDVKRNIRLYTMSEKITIGIFLLYQHACAGLINSISVKSALPNFNSRCSIVLTNSPLMVS